MYKWGTKNCSEGAFYAVSSKVVYIVNEDNFMASAMLVEVSFINIHPRSYQLYLLN